MAGAFKQRERERERHRRGRKSTSLLNCEMIKNVTRQKKTVIEKRVKLNQIKKVNSSNS